MEIVFDNANDLKDYLDSNYKDFINSAYSITEDGIYDTLAELFPTDDLDYDMNQTAYEGVKNINSEEYLDGIISSDVLVSEYNSWLDDYNSEDELSITDNCVSEIADDIPSDTDFEEEFDRAQDKYMEDNERLYGFGEENQDEPEELDYDEKSANVDTWSDLSELDDNIGDTTEVESTENLDYDTRDAAFIYIAGDCIQGGHGETHAQILEKYLEDVGKGDRIPKDFEGDGDIGGSRPSQARMERLTGTKDIAFGHIVDNMAFIEVLESGANEDDVAKACVKQLGVDKAYFYDTNNYLVQRLAKFRCYTK